MSRKNSKDNNDLQLFSEAMQDVKPIKSDKVVHANKAPAAQKRPEPVKNAINQQRIFSTDAVEDVDIVLHFERPGVQKTTLKKLRQGKLPVDDHLDLHGLTIEQARQTLLEFLDYCRQNNNKVVCIVHGKGFGSAGKKPVIKPMVNKWLREVPDILAFNSAQPKDGGSGAVYVLFRRFDK